MKKLFLTSGLVLCMTCPSFASTDIDASGNAGGSAATCVYDVLDSYTGPVSFEAKWDPNFGTITLDDNKYTSSSSTTVLHAATTNATPAPLYSVYGVGVFSGTAPTASTLANYTTANRMTALTARPTLTGYTFGGYYTGKDGTGTQVISNAETNSIQYDAASTQITSVNGSTTFFAKWTPVTYDSGVTYKPGSHGTGSDVTQSVTYDSAWTTKTFAESNFTANTGYTFSGWNTAATGNGTSYTVGQSQGNWTSTDPLTLYAVYTANKYDVTYAAGTCSGDGTTITNGLTYDSNYTVLGTGTGSGTSGVTVPTGYSFGGWTESLTGNATRQAGYVYTPWQTDGGLTLTGICTANAYTITYDCGSYVNNSVTPNVNKTVANGAISVTSSITGYNSTTKKVVQSATYNTTDYTYVTVADMCSLPGYTGAWSCTDGTNAVTPTNGTWNIASNVTCTAQWTPNNITLSWNANGGTLDANDAGGASCTYDQGIDLPATPTKNGYHFTGWTVTNGVTNGN